MCKLSEDLLVLFLVLLLLQFAYCQIGVREGLETRLYDLYQLLYCSREYSANVMSLFSSLNHWSVASSKTLVVKNRTQDREREASKRSHKEKFDP